MQKNNKKSRFKSFLKLAIILAVLSGFLYGFLNIEVITKRAINYKIEKIKIPLYIKAIEFVAREYHYKKLAKDIVKGASNKEEILKSIFEWVTQNIRSVPEDFPIVDDHPLNIIIRGYGTDDQLADVFTILAGYYNLNGEWRVLKPQNKATRILITIIWLDGKPIIFDLKNKNYFLNNFGHLASLDDIEKDISIVERADNKPDVRGTPYIEYFRNIASLRDVAGFTRAKKQFVGNRLKYEFKKAFINLMAK